MVKMEYVWDRTVEFLGDNLTLLLPLVLLGLFLPTSIIGSLADLQERGGDGMRLSLSVLSLGVSLLSL